MPWPRWSQWIRNECTRPCLEFWVRNRPLTQAVHMPDTVAMVPDWEDTAALLTEAGCRRASARRREENSP